MQKVIKGVNVTVDHPSLKGAKKVDDLKSLGLFNHLGADEDAACKELLEVLNPSKNKSDSKEV